MSDFYKYSTRFRKPCANSNISSEAVVSNNNRSPPPPPPPPPLPPPSLQNKGIYQPLQPLSCNVLTPPQLVFF